MLIRRGLPLFLICPLASAGSFVDDFSLGVRPSFWKVTQTTAGQYVWSDTGGTIHFARPAPNNPGGLQNIALELMLDSISGSVAGDFSCQIEIANANIMLAGLNQIELHTIFRSGSVYYNVYDNDSGLGLNYHVWNGSVRARTSTALTSATLKIERVGATLAAYFNGVKFDSITNFSPLQRVRFVLQNHFGSNGLISCNYDNFAFSFSRNCRADLNLDGVVEDADFTVFARGYDLLDCADPAMGPGCPGDLNADGFVDDSDFVIFLTAYNDLICP
ncbi:MAG: hypothetical protein J0L78_14110 [Planctomycetes bacterium]|nr:hypothetical protein [Planctomycetota bacterium]